MGGALLNYPFHERNKVKIVMAFDVDDHELINTKSKDGIPIYGISSIEKLKQEAFKQPSLLFQASRLKKWLAFW